VKFKSIKIRKWDRIWIHIHHWWLKVQCAYFKFLGMNYDCNNDLNAKMKEITASRSSKLFVDGQQGRPLQMRGPIQDETRGPSEHWFYDVIVFSQTCYDRGRAQICSTPLTRKLSTFANVRGNLLVLTGAFFVSSEIYMPFLVNSQAQGVSGKIKNLPKHHGVGPQRRGAQCSCIGCIGFRPALMVNMDLEWVASDLSWLWHSWVVTCVH